MILDNLLRKTLKLWDMLGLQPIAAKIEPPSLNMTQAQLDKLTYDDALKTKEKVSHNDGYNRNYNSYYPESLFYLFYLFIYRLQ